MAGWNNKWQKQQSLDTNEEGFKDLLKQQEEIFVQYVFW